MANRTKLPRLSEAQQEIMEIVWEHEEVSARQVRELLASSRDLARNTVRTLMERMEEKGWLQHRAVGRTFLYSATNSRRATIGQRVLEVVENVCGGKPEELVSALLDYRGLTKGELARIEEMLETAKTSRRRRAANRKAN